jgi:hypothetical protein
VIGICEQALAELKSTHHHPPLIKELTVREAFQISGADEWDALRTAFRPPEPKRDAAE